MKHITHGEESMSQKKVFLSGEGNQWYERNKSALSTATAEDPVLQALNHCMMAPERVLEIGCADGWRLAEIERHYGCQSYGIDPSEQAITTGQAEHSTLQLSVGTADALPAIEPVDLIIFGFCLYLCDPQDLFKIAMESDQLLKDQGHIVVLDFHPPTGHYRNPYIHKEDVFSYKMDYSKLFSWHPAYCLIHQQLFHHQDRSALHFEPNDMVSVQILRKDSRLLQGHNPY